MAITWRNVNGDRGYGDAALLMRGATENINSGFSTVQGLVTDYQKQRTDNYKIAGENNTNAAQDIFAQYLTPEALKTAQEDGSLQQQLGALGQNVDQKVVREGADQQMDKLQTDYVRDTQFQDTQAMDKAKPVIDAYQAALYSGDTTTMNAIQNDPEQWGLVMAARQGDDLAKESTAEADRLRANEQSLYNFNRGKTENGREDAAYKRELGILAGQDTVDSIYNSSVQATAGKDAATKTAWGEGLTALDLPQADTGGVALDKLSPAQEAGYTKLLEDQASTVSPIEEVRQRVAEAAAAGATPTQQRQLEADLTANAAGRMGVDPLTAQRLQADIASVATTNKMDSNESYQGRGALASESMDVVAALSADPESSFGKYMDDVGNRRDVVAKVDEYTQRGFEISPGQFVKLVPSQINKILFPLAEYPGGLDSKSVTKAFTDYLKSDSFITQATAYVDYENQVRQLTAAAQPQSIQALAQTDLTHLQALAAQRSQPGVAPPGAPQGGNTLPPGPDRDLLMQRLESQKLTGTAQDLAAASEEAGRNKRLRESLLSLIQ
jgi:hypothetical protein